MINVDDRALAIAEKMLSEDQQSQFLGIRIVSAAVGYSVCSMVITAAHLNGHGTCHGGVIFTLADTTFAHVCNARNQVSVAHMCNIVYWAPGRQGDQLFAVARENGTYGRSGSYTIRVHRDAQDGEIIAEFSGYSRQIKGQTILSENLQPTDNK